MDDRMTLREAQAILHPRMPSLIRAISQSVQDWRELAQLMLDASARATVINQRWYQHALYYLEADGGVRLCKDQNQRFLIIDERVILRHKHFDDNLRGTNYPTHRALHWVDQTALPGIPSCERLQFGYRLDLAGIAITDVFVTFPRRDVNEWVWQVWGDPIDTFQIGLPGGLGPALAYDHTNYSIAV